MFWVLVILVTPFVFVYSSIKQSRENKRQIEKQQREARTRQEQRAKEERAAIERAERARTERDPQMADYCERIIRCNLSDPGHARAMDRIYREEELGPAKGLERRCLERFEKEVLHLG
ncbi:MAG: hypothetical protein LBL83_14150 [Clostridiales bacterium]|jgi:hemolysin activation/secretion protein|nr:hypothetical protein [Clostridiales bacterium]